MAWYLQVDAPAAFVLLVVVPLVVAGYLTVCGLFEEVFWRPRPERTRWEKRKGNRGRV